MSFIPLFCGSGSSGAANPATKSLSFADASLQYLSMTNANWGAYDRAKFALAGSFKLNAINKEQVIFNRDVSSASNEFLLYVGSTNNIGFTSNNGASLFTGPTSAFSAGVWYSFLVHFDSANATSTERIKIWINNSLVSSVLYTAPTASVPTLSIDTEIGRRKAFAGSSYLDGLLYNMTFFSGSLPTAAQVFNGSAGKLNNLSTLTGAYSLLDGSTAVSDYIKVPDWTNNNGVTTSVTLP